MSTPKEKLTEDQIETKAAELEKEHKCKIHPLVFQVEEGGEQVIGYMKEPSRLVKMRALNIIERDKMGAAAEMLECTLIKEASDPRIYSESPEHDAINIGACVAALKRIEIVMDTFKKK